MRENLLKQVEVIVDAPPKDDGEESIPDEEKKDNPAEMFRRKEPRRSPRLRRRTRELRGGKGRSSELLRIEGNDANFSNTEDQGGRPVDDRITTYTTQFAMADDDIVSNVAQITKAPLTLMSQYRPSFEVSDEDDTDDLEVSEEADKKPPGGDTGSPKMTRKIVQNLQKPGGDLRRLGLLQKFDPKLRAVLAQGGEHKGPLPRSQTLPEMNRPQLTKQSGVEGGDSLKNGSLQEVNSNNNATTPIVRRSALKHSTGSAATATVDQPKENGESAHNLSATLKEAAKNQRLNGIHEEAEQDAAPTPTCTQDETLIQMPLTQDAVMTPSALRAKTGKMQWPPVNNRRPSVGENAAPITISKEKDGAKDINAGTQNSMKNGSGDKPAIPAALQGERWWCLYTPKPPLEQILPSYLKTGCIAAR